MMITGGPGDAADMNTFHIRRDVARCGIDVLPRLKTRDCNPVPAQERKQVLGGRGLEPEPHAGTLTTTTDILRRERRFLPGRETGASTPRNR
jgi:hypothetical protein